MSFAMHRHAALALLPVLLAACASAPPAPPGASHPAHPDTASAPPAKLTILQSYRDFGAQGGAAPAQHAPPKENHDAQEH
jgi:hypothetical protein